MDYREFLKRKQQLGGEFGFDPIWMPDFLFDFQRHLVEWALKRGRAAILADCGLGKSPQELVWAENVVRKTNKPVLLVTPLAVTYQMEQEAEKFQVEAARSRDGRIKPGAKVWITNYEQLEKFDPDLFSGFIGDEGSAIKDFKSKRKQVVTEFVRNIPYRLFGTATAAPNDYHELGTLSEALGRLGYRDMITTFFKQETSKDHLGWGRTKYRFRGHAERPFWRWVCSWARACRKPSDIGFDDDGFVLPPLVEEEIIVECNKCRDGYLMAIPANGLNEQREESRITLDERCERAALEMESHDGSSVAWCHLNDEANALEKMLPNGLQISGSMSDEKKEERFIAFTEGELKHLVIKPKIGAWGLNWQHCNHIVSFPGHSYEQHYQLVRRCYRFGQKKTVYHKLITTEGNQRVLKNLQRKARQADRMFSSLVEEMNNELRVEKFESFSQKEVVPSWV